jgi:hypothetical protein
LRTRYAALLGLGAFGAGGPMLVLGLPASVSLLARFGVVLLWLGTAAALASSFQVQRANHRMLRAQAARIQKIRKPAGAATRSRSATGVAELEARIAEEREALLATIAESHRDVIRTVDARILGLWEELHAPQRDERP